MDSSSRPAELPIEFTYKVKDRGKDRLFIVSPKYAGEGGQSIGKILLEMMRENSEKPHS